jgi:hypothetical protein
MLVNLKAQKFHLRKLINFNYVKIRQYYLFLRTHLASLLRDIFAQQLSSLQVLKTYVVDLVKLIKSGWSASTKEPAGSRPSSSAGALLPSLWPTGPRGGLKAAFHSFLRRF